MTCLCLVADLDQLFKAASGHDLLVFALLLQVVVVLLLLLQWLWNGLLAWRKRAAFAASLEPTVEHIQLPPPGRALMWAVQWDLDLRKLVDDLKSEGPEVLERYFQNEAFVMKLRTASKGTLYSTV